MFRTHMPLALALAGALLLAACSSSKKPEPAPEPAPPPAAEPVPEPSAIDLPEGHGLDDVAEDGKPQSFVLAAGASQRYADTVFSCPAGGDDCTITVTSTLGTVSATSTGGMATAALHVTMPPSGLTQEQIEGLGELLADGGDGVMSVISGLGTGIGQLDVGYGQAPAIKTAAGSPAFSSASAPPSIDDWMGSALERTNADGTVDRVAVYAPASAPAGTDTTFAIKHGNAAGNSNDVSLPNGTAVAVAITGPSSYVPAEVAPGTTPPSGITITLSATLTSVSFLGTYDGVAGTFTCAGAANDTCAIARGADNMVTATLSGATLIFVASDPNAVIPGSSDSFSAFGWWLQTPDGDDEIENYGSYAFVEGTAVSHTTLRTLAGTATYKGPAAGRYVKREKGGQFAMSGAFTASARLTANFDYSVTDAQNNTSTGVSLSGRITGFKDADGNSLGFRRLTLQEDAVTADSGTLQAFSGGAKFDAHGTLTSTTAADVDDAWTASFYDQTGTAQPSTVAGTFGAAAGAFANSGSADSGYAAVAGAFSASK